MPIVRVEYRAPSVDFYYNDSLQKIQNQIGSGTVGGLPVFAASHGILESQTGEGFWSDVLWPGIKAIGKQILGTGSQIVVDKIRNPERKLGQIAKRRLVEGGQSLLDKGYKKASSYLEEQSGSGCSLAKKFKMSKRRKSKSRRRKATKTSTKRKKIKVKKRKRVYRRKKKTNKRKVKRGRVTKRQRQSRRRRGSSKKRKGSKLSKANLEELFY
jgi:hypothetical protein